MPSRIRLRVATDGFNLLDSIREIVALLMRLRFASARCDIPLRSRTSRSRRPTSIAMGQLREVVNYLEYFTFCAL